jgi:TM2 domain-containing membrane protein YozV
VIAKTGLSTQQLLMVQSEFDKKKKNKTTAYLIWFFLGGFGGHRFYIGDTGLAVAMLFLNWLTLGIWALVDAFILSGRVDALNAQTETAIISEVRSYQQAAATTV